MSERERKCKDCGRSRKPRKSLCDECRVKRTATNRRKFIRDGIEYKNLYQFCLSIGFKKKQYNMFSRMIKEGIDFEKALEISKDFKAYDNKLKLEECHKIAKAHGGKCLSTEYKRSDTKMKWECANGHIFETTLDTIKRGCWCKYCSSTYYTESLCRVIISTLFGCEFKKGRFFDWLRNEDGNLLESDGYSESLSMAFEYHGSQHFIFSEHFHGTLENFEKRKANDRYKADLYQKHNIKYIEITYRHVGSLSLPIENKINNIKDRILRECSRLGIFVPYPDAVIDSSLAYIGEEWRLDEIRESALQDGYRLISNRYEGMGNQKYEFMCINDHQFTQTYTNFKNVGCRCPECYIESNSFKQLEECYKIAEENGGECLDTEYINSNIKMKWRCSKGHKFKLSFSAIKNGRWCKKCYLESKRFKFRGVKYDTILDCCKEYGINSSAISVLTKSEGWTVQQALEYKIDGVGELKSRSGICMECGCKYIRKGQARYCISCRKKKELLRAQRRRKRDKEKIEVGRREWGSEEDLIILNYGREKSLLEMQELLPGRTQSAIKNRRLKLGIKVG